MADPKVVSASAAMLLSAALWAFIGVFTRNLSAAGFSALQTAFARMFIGAAVIIAVLAVMDRSAFRIRRSDIWVFFLFGAFKILSDFFLFEAQVRIHLSLSTVLQMMSPYWVLFLSVFLFGERITARKVTAICMAFIGCIFVTGLLSDDVSFDAVGVVFAVLSGVAFAVYTVGNKVLMNRGYSVRTVVLYIFIFSTVISCPFGDVASIPGKIVSADVVLNLLGMGILMSLIPYCLQAYALEYLSAVKANLLGVTEALFAVIVGYVIYSEELGFVSVIGMILIPLSIVVMNVSLRRAHMKWISRGK